MCRPTKRPRPLAPATASTGLITALTSPETMPVEDMKDDFANFTFDLKSDDLSLLNQVWQTELSFPEPSEFVQIPPQAEVEGEKPRTFVFTTFDMVSDIKNAAVIGFNTEGDVIEIRDLELLAEKILPAYFRHKNITSFYRQLNSYGFRTIRSVSPDVMHAFSHESFRRDRPDLLQTIQRKKSAKRAGLDKKEDQTDPPSPVSMSSTGSAEDQIEQQSPAKVDQAAKSWTSARSVNDSSQVMDVIEQRNASLRLENEALRQESESIVQNMNSLVDIQVELIQKLFGFQASQAFAQQAKPFRMDTQGEMVSDSIMSGVRDANSFNQDSMAMMLADDDLALLEDMFTEDDLVV